MSEPLKVGDRVRVYGPSYAGVSMLVPGQIVKIIDKEHVHVRCNVCTESYHSKQLRRLVKRSPLRVWVEIGDTNHAPRVYFEKPKGIATIECVQVKR